MNAILVRVLASIITLIVGVSLWYIIDFILKNG